MPDLSVLNGIPFESGNISGLRVGCDIVALDEVAESIEAFGDRYLRRVFTQSELSSCIGDVRIAGLAARWAAKEAVVKTFGAHRIAVPFTDIEIVRELTGVPRVRLHGVIAEAAARDGWIDIRVSLSHTDCHAIALVVVARASALEPAEDSGL